MNNTKSSYWYDAIIQWAEDNDIPELDENNMGIPRDKEKLYNSEEINLLHYDAKNLPKEIKYLRNLDTLDMSFSNLESIPDEIGNLFNLEDLSLGVGKDNLDLPDSIKKLKKLKYVSLSGNFSNKSIYLLLDLPITYLRITYNDNLLNLPEDFFLKLKDLNYLELSNVNNLVLPDAQYKLALQLRKPDYCNQYNSVIKERMLVDYGKGFRYFSYWRKKDEE